MDYSCKWFEMEHQVHNKWIPKCISKIDKILRRFKITSSKTHTSNFLVKDLFLYDKGSTEVSLDIVYV